MVRILVADDDPVTREAVMVVLGAEGFRTVEAADGEAAMARWRESRCDLLLLDIMMPGLDGFEVCRQVRREDSHVPVLFLSAKSEEIDVVVGLRLGADDFVRKPFGKHELLARIHAALRRSRNGGAPPSPSFEVGDLVVVPRELRAERAGQPVELTPREASILALLHENRGQPVSRDQILDRCWGTDYFPESRTLDQHVANLRKKVEPDPGRFSVIETVRGVGYRMPRAAKEG